MTDPDGPHRAADADARQIDHERVPAGTMLRRGAVPFVCGLLALALLAFIVQNRQHVDMHWLAWTFTAPLWVDLVLTAAAAILVVSLPLLIVLRRRGARLRHR